MRKNSSTESRGLMQVNLPCYEEDVAARDPVEGRCPWLIELVHAFPASLLHFLLPAFLRNIRLLILSWQSSD
jgi:hypothetical protein